MAETVIAAAPAIAAPAPPRTVIEAEKLNIAFAAADRPVVALQDVDLTVAEGDFVSLIGPSGCGKTTLLRAIADLAPLTSGTLTVNGMSPDQARRNRAYGYVFQAPALFPWRNVQRNVTLPLELIGMTKEERERRAAENLARLGLKDFAKKFPWQLSGGMQQRVSIARALSFNPSLLLMDEPFGALDEITRDSLNLHVHELWRRTGMTAVFVTHSIPEAVFLSTRIVVMSARPGRVLRVIESRLPAQRTLDMRDDPAFVAVAHQVRESLREGHSYD
jgi:NitT/TauT family transport system ATP-binding protein